MAYQELDAYIAGQVAQGLDAQTIKKAVLEAGWLEIDVDNALRDVAADAIPATAVSAHDDIVRMRNALNSLDERVKHLESRLSAAPEATLPSGTIGPERELPEPPAKGKRRIMAWIGLSLLFILIGYVGMKSIVQDAITPVSRLWAEAFVGFTLASAGFVSGRMKKRGAANLLTGTGLAFAALATVGAWYLNYIEWSVALAVGALLVTLALVLGRFYDVWAIGKPTPRTA